MITQPTRYSDKLYLHIQNMNSYAGMSDTAADSLCVKKGEGGREEEGATPPGHVSMYLGSAV